MYFKKDIFKVTATENYVLGGLQMETLQWKKKKCGVGRPPENKMKIGLLPITLKHIIINKMNSLIISFY